MIIFSHQPAEGEKFPKFHFFNCELITYDIETNEQLAVTELRQSFMVNHANFNKEKIDKDERMDEYEPMHLQIPPYDPTFWKNYNVLKLHPRDEKLIKGLEDKMELEEQFSSNQ